MICHSYIKLPDGIGLAVQNWADLGSGSGAWVWGLWLQPRTQDIAKGLPCEWPVWTRATRIA